MSAASANIDPLELAKFSRLADQWWDRDGPFKTLHDINPLRLDYVQARAPLAGARVLDVGCGGGLLAEGMAAVGATVIGIDLSEANLAAARRHAEGGGLDVEYRAVEVAELAAAAPGSFDVVTCLEMLEHVPYPEQIVAACARAVKPGGAVFFSTINRNLSSFLLAIVGAEYVLGMLPRGTHEYRKLIRPSELSRAIRQTGLQLKELTGLHYNPLTQTYRLGGNVQVNYFAHTTRPDAT